MVVVIRQVAQHISPSLSLAGIATLQIHDCYQIDPAITRPDVCHITAPRLVGAAHCELPIQCVVTHTSHGWAKLNALSGYPESLSHNTAKRHKAHTRDEINSYEPQLHYTKNS